MTISCEQCYEPSGFYKKRRISWPAEWLVISQYGLCSVELKLDKADRTIWTTSSSPVLIIKCIAGKVLSLFISVFSCNSSSCYRLSLLCISFRVPTAADTGGRVVKAAHDLGPAASRIWIPLGTCIHTAIFQIEITNEVSLKPRSLEFLLKYYFLWIFLQIPTHYTDLVTLLIGLEVKNAWNFVTTSHIRFSDMVMNSQG